MGKKNQFAAAVEESQAVPDAPEVPGLSTPDLLSGAMGQLGSVNTGEEEDKESIPGMTNYDMNYHSARLTIGQKMTGFVDGHAEFEDLDESDDLEDIMNKTLNGKAMLFKKDHSFLKDGTIIVWLEWGEYSNSPKKENREYLTTEELTSPERIGNDSEDVS